MTVANLGNAKPIADKNGREWIPIGQLEQDPNQVDIVETNDGFYDVLGYSDKRKALWVQRIQIDGSAEGLEIEVEDYVKNLKDKHE
jgi:hypothetical protein